MKWRSQNLKRLMNKGEKSIINIYNKLKKKNKKNMYNKLEKITFKNKFGNKWNNFMMYLIEQIKNSKGISNLNLLLKRNLKIEIKKSILIMNFFGIFIKNLRLYGVIIKHLEKWKWMMKIQN